MPADDRAKIEPLSDYPAALPVAARWIWETWGSKTLGQTIELLDDPKDCPPTLIAVADKRPVGVLGFGRWQRPDDSVETLWINSLYVVEGERSSGLGSRLLVAAVDVARSFASELYVYTDISTWYQQRGWETIEVADHGSVLRRRMMSSR